MEGPVKSSMKRRSSLLIVTTPPPLRQASLTPSPDINREDDLLHRPHAGIDRLVEEEEEVIPEHHRVLYELLGCDKADSILNPKIEEPSKPDEVETEREQKRKLPEVDACLGAGALWNILKRESDKKLYNLDRKIPLDWKRSYGAYMRNNINQNRSLVERSFTRHTDVPELDKLLDLRYKDRVQKARHHTNVMFQSSENNKNRTTLLLGNNPVPDYIDREGNEPLSRYFPLYLNSPTTPSSGRRMKLAPLGASEVKRTMLRQYPNLHFLTEDSARTKGRFYGKYANDDAMKMVTDVPGYNVELPPSMKERVAVSAPVHDVGGTRPSDSQLRLFAPRPPAQRDPTWQPLTVGALMEYASTKHAVGAGEFRHGQSSRWKPLAPATA